LLYIINDRTPSVTLTRLDQRTESNSGILSAQLLFLYFTHASVVLGSFCTLTDQPYNISLRVWSRQLD
jgi:hypothetical protein